MSAVNPTLHTIIAEGIRRGLIDFIQSGQPLDAYLSAQLGESQAAELLAHVARVSEAADQVAQARARGVSPGRWLQDTIFGQRDIDDLTRELAAKLGVDLDVPGQLGAALLRAAMAGAGLIAGQPDLIDPVTILLDEAPQAVRDALDACFSGPMGDPREAELTAAAAAGILRAAQAVDIPIDMEQAVMVADMGVQVAKLGYKLATGECTLDEVAERVEERMAANLASAAGQLFERGAPVLGEALGRLVETYIPMGGLAVQAGRVIGGLVGSALRPAVEAGVKAITKSVFSAAREAVRAASNVVLGAAKTLLDWLF